MYLFDLFGIFLVEKITKYIKINDIYLIIVLKNNQIDVK